MKTIAIALLIFVITTISAEEPFVEIYKTHDNGLYGRSINRDIVLSLKKSVFKRHKTIDVDKEYNFLTAVVLDKATVNKLEEMFLNSSTVQLGFVKISKLNNVYTIEDDNLFLSLSFSVEEPGEEILYVINKYYPESSIYREIVTNHYKDNYVIRIHSAENLINPEAEEITYDEALIMATIIGDESQWLWGIHDGNNYLCKLLFN